MPNLSSIIGASYSAQLNQDTDFNGFKAVNFESTGIDDNATSTALTIDASGNVSGNFTGNLTGDLTGTVLTASQPNITSVGTLTGFTSTGIDDNATSTAVTIDLSGNVGIGNTSGDVAFTVGSNDSNGDGSLGIGFYNEINGATTSGMFPIRGGTQLFTGVGLKSSGTVAGGFETTSPIYTGIHFSANSVNSTLRYIRFLISQSSKTIGSEETGDEVMRITSSGNVGIGTTNPQRKLHAVAGQESVFRLESTAGRSMIEYLDSGGDGARVYAGNASGAFVIFTGGSSPTEKVRITSSGNVGIGTSSPAFKVSQEQTSGNSFAFGSGGFTFDGVTIPDYGVSYTQPSGEFNLVASAFSNIKFCVNRSERMRIDSSGNVGIGTSAPTHKLTVSGGLLHTDRSLATTQNHFEMGSATTNTFGHIGLMASSANMYFGSDLVPQAVIIDRSNGNVGIGTSNPSRTLEVGSSTTNNFFRLSSSNGTRYGEIYTDSNGLMILNANADAGGVAPTFRIQVSGTERMRIDSSGNLLVGKTSASAAPAGSWIQNQSGNRGRINNSKTVSGTFPSLANYHNNTYVGGVSYSDTATSFPTSSDIRLKENIVDAPSAASDIDAIQIRSFDWKADGYHQKYGVIAQELEVVAPYAVSKGETEEDTWGVDYSKLVPMMVKEIQELRARVAQLEV